MKNYLLMIVGNIESEKMCKEIALSISPLVDSPNLKFQHKNGTLLFHFGTEIPQFEIYDYICGILYGTVDTFILTEMSDKVSVFMPNEMFGHLFDLENVDEDVTMKLDMGRIIKNTDFEEEIEDEFIATLLGELDSRVTKPSLDQILDKINTKGYNCLTPFERDTLENYSKN
jgi:hypothetical protein